VVLVNYGPVGIPFGGVSDSISRRCTMIGYMSPDCRSAREQFREIVRNCVGNPAPATSDVTSVHSPSVDTVMLIDISGSMRDVLGSDRLWELVEHFAGEIVLADDRIRGRVRRETVRDWLSKHSLGGSTSLMGPISELLEQHGRLLVLTDSGGAESLIGQNAAVTDLGLPGDSSTKLLRVVKRDT
jgi:hypothetical protein